MLFVKYEDKCEVINKVFKRDKKKYTQINHPLISLKISEGTLIYGWGSANKGKLGLSLNNRVLLKHSQFYQECK